MKTFSQVVRNYWVDLILLNLAFLLGCIPVVTIPASLAALCSAVLRMQRAQDVHIFRDFFRDVRTRFLRSMLPGCIAPVGLALFFLGWNACMAAASGRGRLPLLAALLLWLYVVFAFSMYAVPLAAQLELPLRAVFRNALILLLARTWQNIAALLLVGACTLLLLLTSPFLLPLVLFTHFSLCALICMSFAEGGIRQCIAG
ncbi:YesL family protein [Flavonifractor sp. DFI.6.63]|uniref:YesL family protein n=1 Tax=Lawsonibacter hominis TaxID=2763053 RepID=A0A8J6JE57_9FIRM|nr:MULTISPECIES: YesL family protein [Oscillospiraceae]MBS1383372.1 YesL family protein [Flavonifractor sp.]MDU2195639.1 YesL family protein [Clostridiales bacterium]MDY2976593.1 YesL family protein [Oscillospiraceae bacterium]MBC5733120.1 YesL family protein [Lawsonibacter hominis]MCI6398219.1 YesL family protein [Lawsonibacter sp.]